MPDPAELQQLADVFPATPPSSVSQQKISGRLTAIGLEQMRKVGAELRKVFVEEQQFMPRDLESLDMLRVWSTSPSVIGTERTVESARALLTGLYPRERLHLPPGSLCIDTSLPAAMMIPDSTFMSKEQTDLEQAYRDSSTRAAHRAAHAGFQARLSFLLQNSVLPSDSREWEPLRWEGSMLGWHYIWDVLSCLDAADGLPHGVSREDLAMASGIAVHDWFGMFQWEPGVAQLAAGQLLERFLLEADGPEAAGRLHLYSAHDSTLAAVAAAARLGVPMDWPPFASVLRLELREDDAGRFVQWVYNGRVVPVMRIFGEAVAEAEYDRIPIGRLWDLYPWLPRH